MDQLGGAVISVEAEKTSEIEIVEGHDQRNLFGDRLRTLREKHGLNVKELARMARVQPARLSRIERGELVNPDASTVNRLASALGMSLEVFQAETSAVVSSPMRPSMSPRVVLELVSQIRWTSARTAAFRELAREWMREDAVIKEVSGSATDQAE